MTLVGPQQVGKTTLAHELAQGRPSSYLDLESRGESDRRLPAWQHRRFYRTSAGAEIDLVLELPGGTLWAIEIKRGLAPRPEKGFHFAREDLKPQRTFVVYSGTERYPIGSGVEAIGVRELAAMLVAA